MTDRYNILDLYRIEKRMSYAELARRIGVSDNVLKRTLRGETTPHDYNEASFNDFIENNVLDIVESTGKKITIGCLKNP